MHKVNNVKTANRTEASQTQFVKQFAHKRAHHHTTNKQHTTHKAGAKKDRLVRRGVRGAPAAFFVAHSATMPVAHGAIATVEHGAKKKSAMGHGRPPYGSYKGSGLDRPRAL